MGLIPEEIQAHYLQGAESERLSNEWGELERIRTQAILARHLPPRPAVILDVGGAAGAYAFPLAKQGYEVHLIDPVELHLEQARSYAKASGVTLASIAQGDARHLDFPANRADAVLLLGPLYHLTERPDRLQALLEARRVLRPRGILFAASISRFASLIDGLSRGFFQDAEFREIGKRI
jgi:ubiquinone/menaquinone biosynthesis C-methylase UbiE